MGPNKNSCTLALMPHEIQTEIAGLTIEKNLTIERYTYADSTYIRVRLHASRKYRMHKRLIVPVLEFGMVESVCTRMIHVRILQMQCY